MTDIDWRDPLCEAFIAGAACDGAGDGFVVGGAFVADAAGDGVDDAGFVTGAGFVASAGFVADADFVSGACHDVAWRSCRIRSARASLCSVVRSVENSLP